MHTPSLDNPMSEAEYAAAGVTLVFDQTVEAAETVEFDCKEAGGETEDQMLCFDQTVEAAETVEFDCKEKGGETEDFDGEKQEV